MGVVGHSPKSKLPCHLQSEKKQKNACPVSSVKCLGKESHDMGPLQLFGLQKDAKHVMSTISHTVHFTSRMNKDSIPVVPARGGPEVALAALAIYYKTFLIYRICMRRAPARPVRACFVRSCCTDVVQEHDLPTTPAQCNAKRTLSSHFTVHASHPALRTSHTHFALDISSHVKSRELFSPHLGSSHLFSSHPISSHMSSK